MCSQVENGHIERVVDREIKSSTIEVQGRNLLWFVSRNWILHPRLLSELMFIFTPFMCV